MADAVDHAGDVIERNLANALAQHQLPEFAGVDWARLECEECGEEIPAARREAAPWATTCIECQSIREEKRRHVR